FDADTVLRLASRAPIVQTSVASGRRRVAADLEAPQFVDQRRATELQQPGRLTLVPTSLFEAADDEVPLELRDDGDEIDALVGNRHGEGRLRLVGLPDLLRKLRHAYFRACAAHRDGVLHGVFELADIARPRMVHEGTQRLLRDGLARKAVGLTRTTDE